MKNLKLRLIAIGSLILPFFFFGDFYKHFSAYLSGNIITNIITREWHIVVLSAVLFLAFLIPLSFRRKANWLEYGLVGAFFVSLFIEMYGIPLTILFASKYFFKAGLDLPANVLEFRFFGVGFGMDLPMVYGSALLFIGAFLIIAGWITLYKNAKKNKFVETGIYRYSRHPQYLGFILIILGWFVGWPTPLTLIFAPILIYKYVKVCKVEEKEMTAQFPEYSSYAKKTPFLI